MDALGELLGPGPGGHRQCHLYLHPPTARAHRSHQAELTERQADLGSRTAPIAASNCNWSAAMHSLVSGGIGPPVRRGTLSRRPAEGPDPSVDYPRVSTAPMTAETERGAGADDGRFSAAVAAVAAAFGDPTRRDIFLHVRAVPGATASEVARTFSLHPNVARHHLQRLVDGGYVRVETGRNPTGAGRPSKRFFCVEEELQLGLMQRRDNLLMRLLGEAIEGWGPRRPRRWRRSSERSTGVPWPRA